MKADLHVHSCHSAHPSEWFLQRLGTRECYTTPEEVHRAAMRSGMDLVAITDHNSIDGALWLRDKYPQTTIVGVEATAYFPEDKCKVHVLVYDIDRELFNEIERARQNIYDLCALVRERGLTHSVAHATFNINRLLTRSHVERLLVLFDHFESHNGSRSEGANARWARILAALTPAHMEELSVRYGIKPQSERSWQKGVTGGSDDHSGLFIGRTWTVVPEACTREAFLAGVRAKQSHAAGRHNDYRGFAFSLYKIAYEFSKSRRGTLGASMLGMLNRVLLEGKPVGLRSRFVLNRIKRRKGAAHGASLRRAFVELVEEFESIKELPPERKTQEVYDRLCRLSDELVRSTLQGMSRSAGEGDLAGFVREVSGLIPFAFLSLPFFTTISVLHDSRGLTEDLERAFGVSPSRRSRRILWFTDTLTDLNGPSETIRRLGWLSLSEGLELAPVACLPAGADHADLPPQLIRLPAIWSYAPSFFSTFTLHVPSLLSAMKLVCDTAPDEVLISTPGPVGLLGLLAARLLHVPCRGIYHTDFGAQARLVLDDETMARGIDEYVRWFSSQCDELYVPTRHYMRILQGRGYDQRRMRLFRRGVEHEVFSPIPQARARCAERFGLRSDGLTLLYAGRISKEKSMDFLADLYERLSSSGVPVNLLLCGDGPYLEQMRQRLAGHAGVHFTGRLPRNELPLLYSAADLMLFPSVTDTFGMVVLEAQACGLPAVVSDVGGPQEVIRPGDTGFVARAGDLNAWAEAVLAVRRMIEQEPERYASMRRRARAHVLSTYDWRIVLHDLFGLVPTSGAAPEATAAQAEPVFAAAEQ